MPQFTKYALENSLKKLLLQKPLNKITINDITEDCGINHGSRALSGFSTPSGRTSPLS